MTTFKYLNNGAKAIVSIIDRYTWNIDIIESTISSKGYASKLINRIKKDALSKGIKRISLLSSIYNSEYFEVYHNFSKVGEVYDGILMEYNLKIC